MWDAKRKEFLCSCDMQCNECRKTKGLAPKPKPLDLTACIHGRPGARYDHQLGFCISSDCEECAKHVL